MITASHQAIDNTLYVLLAIFAFALLFFPNFADALGDFLKRHAAATRAAYQAYQNTWNGPILK